MLVLTCIIVFDAGELREAAKVNGGVGGTGRPAHDAVGGGITVTFGEVVGVTFVLQLAAQLKELDPLAVGLVAQV